MKIRKNILIIILSISIILFGFYALNIYYTIQKFDKISSHLKESYLLKPNRMILIDYEKTRIDTVFLENKKVFIQFWATWCNPCVKEFNLFDSIFQHQKEFEIYFITNEDSLTVSKFLNRNNYKYISFYSLKENDSIFNYKGLPTTYFSINDSLLKRVTGKYNWKSFFDKTTN